MLLESSSFDISELLKILIDSVKVLSFSLDNSSKDKPFVSAGIKNIQ